MKNRSPHEFARAQSLAVSRPRKTAIAVFSQPGLSPLTPCPSPRSTGARGAKPILYLAAGLAPARLESAGTSPAAKWEAAS
jgi:hypothetical protein